jgi:hypothetical protein
MVRWISRSPPLVLSYRFVPTASISSAEGAAVSGVQVISQASDRSRTNEDDGGRKLVSNAEQLAHKLRTVAQVLLNQL